MLTDYQQIQISLTGLKKLKKCRATGLVSHMVQRLTLRLKIQKMLLQFIQQDQILFMGQHLWFQHLNMKKHQDLLHLNRRLLWKNTFRWQQTSHQQTDFREKKKQVYLQVVMQLTHLMEQRFQSGFQIMYQLIMEQVPLCVYLHMMTETLNSQRNLIYQLFRLLRKMEKKLKT